MNNIKNKIPYGKQHIDFNDFKSVETALNQKIITGGKYVNKFENSLKKKLKSKYVSTCINATAGLHLAFMSINLKKNDVVVMPVINFISAFRIATSLGARIFLADVDKSSGQMTPQTLKDCIKKNKLAKIKLILTMYLGGYAENVSEFYEIKKKYNSFIIEDSCHAFGSKYKFKEKLINVGSCKHADISVFSFHPVKPITTGEGGAISTNNKNLAIKINLLRNHGIVRKKNYWDYDIKQLGFNYRLSDINCALGLSQLKKLPFFLSRRKNIYYKYLEKISKYSNILKIYQSNESFNSYHLILLSINFKKIKYTKDHLINYLNKKGIFPQYHYKPIYKFTFYKKSKKLFYYGAEYFYKNTLSLPVYHNLTTKNQERVINNLIKYIKKNKKKN